MLRQKRKALNLNLLWTVSQFLFSIYLARIVLVLDGYNGGDKGGYFLNMISLFLGKLPMTMPFHPDNQLLVSIPFVATGELGFIFIMGKYRAILTILSYAEGFTIVLGLPLLASLTWVEPSPMMLLESLVVATAIFGFQHWNRNNGMPYFIALSIFHFSVWVEYQWIYQFVNTAALLTWGYEMWLRRETPYDELDASVAA